MDEFPLLSDYLTDLSPKDKSWDNHRGLADIVREIYASAKNDRYADRIKQCSKLLEFGLVAAENDEQRFKLLSAKFCRVRHCPVCQWRRSLKWRAKFFQAMPAITQSYPTHRWIFLTLTVRNCELADLRSTISIMNKAFVRLTQLKEFPGVGWIKSLEVTRSAVLLAHPHFHCLILVPSGYFGGKSYIKTSRWAELWQQCLRVNYLPVVNVKAVKGKSRDPEDISAAVCETLKYSVTPDDFFGDIEPDDKPKDPIKKQENWLIELTRQLHKVRAVSVGGCLREFMRQESDDDDLVNVEDSEDAKLPESDISLFFGWREVIKRYKLK